jgi:hypothetical protein
MTSGGVGRNVHPSFMKWDGFGPAPFLMVSSLAEILKETFTYHTPHCDHPGLNG